MKRLTSLLFLVIAISLFSLSKSTNKKLKRYSGENYKAFLELVDNANSVEKVYLEFLLDNISKNDCAALTPKYLSENVDYALKSKLLSYTNYNDEIFKHFVLPHRASQEPLEDWRKMFYEQLEPRVKNAKDIQEAAIIVNFWVHEQMTFKQTHGRDQGPITTINRGFGRCEESMIIYILAARSVGIPARSASVPYWNNSDSNHAWVEVWTPQGWKYIGEVESSLSNTWFTKPTTRATMITSHAFGKYQDDPLLNFNENSSTLSSTHYYTDVQKCEVSVYNKNGRAVKNADVTLYATTFGGLSPIITFKTRKDGSIDFPMGNASVYVIAHKDGKVAAQLLNPVSDKNNAKLVLDDKKVLADDFNMMFAKTNDNRPQEPKYFGEYFNMMRDNANLKRKDRIANNKNFKKFMAIIDAVYPDIQNEKIVRTKFIENALQLNDLANNYLKTFENLDNQIDKEILVQMIARWDVKELCEPKSQEVINDYVSIYRSAKDNFTLVDSIFFNNIIAPTWGSFTYPAYYADKDLVAQIKDLKSTNISLTKDNIMKWLDKSIKIDKDFTYTYYSGSLTSSQVLRMKNISEDLRLQLLNQALIFSGIPTQWKGQLEYFNGTEFIPVEISSKKNDVVQEVECEIMLMENRTILEPKAWGNFRIMALTDGRLTNVFFDGNVKDSIFKATINSSNIDNLMIVSFIRNENGDANVRIIPLVINELNRVQMISPQEAKIVSKWTSEKLKPIIKFTQEHNKKYSFIFVGGKEILEPEKRMLERIKNNLLEKNLQDTEVYFLSSKMAVSSRKYHSYGNLAGLFEDQKDYPMLFIFENGKLIHSTEGLNLEAVDKVFRMIN